MSMNFFTLYITIFLSNLSPIYFCLQNETDIEESVEQSKLIKMCVHVCAVSKLQNSFN